MRSLKVMLLGIGLILVGIFFRLWSIGYGYSEMCIRDRCDLFGKGVQHRARACGDAAGGHADHDARGIVRRFPRIHGLFHLVADGGKFF